MLNLRRALGPRATRWSDDADAPQVGWLGALGSARYLGRHGGCSGTSNVPWVRSPHSRECRLAWWGTNGDPAAPSGRLRTPMPTRHRDRKRPPRAARSACPSRPLRLLRPPFRLRSARVRSAEICHIPCGCVVPTCDRAFINRATITARYYMEDTYGVMRGLLRRRGSRSVERGPLRSKRGCRGDGRDWLVVGGSEPSRVNVISVFTCA